MLKLISFLIAFWPVIAWLWKKLGGWNIWGPEDDE